MKKVKIIVPLLLLTLVLVGAGCGKYSSPEKTFHTLMDAAEAGDVEAYLDCFTEESRALIESSGTAVSSESLKASVPEEDYELKVVEKKGDRAVLTSNLPNSGNLIFKKEKGAWKIDFKATMEEAFQGYQE